MNKTIFKCQFGSHIYGTNIETSDLDYKAIFIPDSRDLVLQKASKHLQQNTKKGSDTRNTSEDVDFESFSVQQWLKLLCEGQTVALDMLFCPDQFILETSSTWEYLKANKEAFLHKGTSAFVGYTKQQAAKYGVKGFRVASLRQVLEWLSLYKDHERLHEIGHDAIYRWICEINNENINIIDVQGKVGPEPHLEVCNRKVPFHATVKYAKDVYQRIFDIYGERALKAEKNEGIDWKALMHAVRVAREAEELLLTGNITFPRPEKELLLKVRKGEMDYKEVEKIIEEGLIKIDQAQEQSILRSKPDYNLADKLVFDIYYAEILHL